MALTADQITAQNFKDFYGQIRPYLNGAAHSGFTPVGTVISVMGKTAPLNYLACDGSVVNIADYPELANYFAGQFEAANYFGGDGVTTFAVPDLRGEFLRGTGTNSHTNQGDGAVVGVHQDATFIPHVGAANDSGVMINRTSTTDPLRATDIDSGKKTSASGTTSNWRYTNGWADASSYNMISTRPTNTSVLYCIATKNIFMDAGMNFSTEEQVVGTWIGGEPLYQKVFDNLSIDIRNEGPTSYDSGQITPLLTGIKPIKAQGIGTLGGYDVCEDVTVRILNNGNWTFYTSCDVTLSAVILCYTKTT